MDTLPNRIIWGALVTALFAYVGVAHVVSLPRNTEVPIDLLAAAFAALSAVVGAGTLLYRRRALVGPIQAGTLDPTTPDGLLRAFQPFLMNLVLSESIGVYGLVLALLSGEPGYALAFCGAAGVLLWLHRPMAGALARPLDSRRRAEDSRPIG